MVNELFPEILRHDFYHATICFQQAGATAHTARQSINKLRTMSEQGIIARYVDISRPNRSPDLSACDFSSWGYLQSRLIQAQQIEVHNLKRRIYDETKVTAHAVLLHVRQSVLNRVHRCIQDLRWVLFFRSNSFIIIIIIMFLKG
jgi:hypothetical protein